MHQVRAHLRPALTLQLRLPCITHKPPAAGFVVACTAQGRCLHNFRMPTCCVLAITRYEKVGSEGYHSLFRWYSAFEAAQFPDPSGLRARVSAWTLGESRLLPAGSITHWYTAVLYHMGATPHTDS